MRDKKTGRVDRSYQTWKHSADNNSATLQTLYAAIKEQALSVIYNVLHENRPEMAADVTSSAIANIRNFDGRCKFSTWTHRIAHNAAVDYLRKHREQPIDPGDIDLIAVPGSYKAVEAGRLLEQLSSLLAPDEAAFFSLFRQGMTCEEAAQELGVGRKYVERQWAALRAKLRRLAGWDYERKESACGKTCKQVRSRL